MTQVGTRELKNRLSHYLRLVGAGASFVVTDHGRPVAEIRPVSEEGRAHDQAWLRAAAAGWVTAPTRKRRTRIKRATLKGDWKVADAVIEGRG